MNWKGSGGKGSSPNSTKLPGGTEENHENLGQNSLSPNLDLNLGPPEYDAGVLALNHNVRYRYVI
jgi:hypothetical protein